MRVNHTYGHGGALAYPAAYDVHQATVFGRTEPTTGIAPIMTLIAQAMSREPYASAKRAPRAADNGSSHRGNRGKKAAARLAAAFPNAVPAHTPAHASRLNQAEIIFSVVQRKAAAPNDFTDLAQVGDRLRAFENRYNATAQPFQWNSPPPTWTICWPGSIDTPPIIQKNPPSPWQRDQPPKDFQPRPLSLGPRRQRPSHTTASLLRHSKRRAVCPRERPVSPSGASRRSAHTDLHTTEFDEFHSSSLNAFPTRALAASPSVEWSPRACSNVSATTA
jgi:hypothetical protein